MNEVFISGKIKSADKRQNGDILELTVEVSRQGNGDTVRTDMFNVLFTGENKYLEEQLSATKSKNTFITVSGFLSERNLSKEGEDRNSQVYMIATNLHAISSHCEDQRAFATVSGDVMYRNFQYTQNGTPRLRYIVRNRRTARDRERSTGIFVTTFKEDTELQFNKGDVIVVSGRLESNEKQPGVYSCEMVAFDVFVTDSRSAPLLQVPQIPATENSPSLNTKLNLDLNDDVINVKDSAGLPF